MGPQHIGIGHPEVKDVLAIQRNTSAERHSFVIAEGFWATRLALRLEARIEKFFHAPELVHSTEVQACADELERAARDTYRVSEKTMKRMAQREGPDGLLAVVAMPRWSPDSIQLGESSLVVIADGIEKPGNLGTLLRTCDATRVDALVMVNRRTRMSHPKVFNGSKGMTLKVPHLEFTQVADVVEWLKERGFDVYLADTHDSVNYRSVDYSGRTAIVVGNERYGVSNAWYGRGFRAVGIPMLGAVDSLNVSVSASVLLYEARARKDRW